MGLFHEHSGDKHPWLTIGTHDADKWTRKIFAMQTKDVSWRVKDSNEQKLLIEITKMGYNVPSPVKQAPETPLSLQQFVEGNPFLFEFPASVSIPFKASFSQFFGTPICEYAQEVEYRPFLKREIYSVFAREALRDFGMNNPGARDQVSQTSVSNLFKSDKFPKTRFGIVRERKPGSRTGSRTLVWKWYNSIFTQSRENTALWRDVVQKADVDATPLKESTFKEKYASQPTEVHPSRKRKRVSIDPAGPRVFKPKEHVKPIPLILKAGDPLTFKNLMSLIKAEGKLKENKRTGYTSINKVSENLEVDKELYRILEGVKKPDDMQALHYWETLYKHYKILVKPLKHGSSSRMSKPTLEDMDRLTQRARETLLRMHKAIIKTMVERPNLYQKADYNWKDLWTRYYAPLADLSAAQRAQREYDNQQDKPKPKPKLKPKLKTPSPSPPRIEYGSPPVSPSKRSKSRERAEDELPSGFDFGAEPDEEDIVVGQYEAEGALVSLIRDFPIHVHGGIEKTGLDAIETRYEKSINRLKQFSPSIAEAVEKIWKLTPKELEDRGTVAVKGIPPKTRAKSEALEVLLKKLKKQKEPPPKKKIAPQPKPSPFVPIPGVPLPPLHHPKAKKPRIGVEPKKEPPDSPTRTMELLPIKTFEVIGTDPPVVGVNGVLIESPGLRNIVDSSASVLDSVGSEGRKVRVSSRSPTPFHLMGLTDEQKELMSDEKVDPDPTKVEEDAFSDVSSQQAYRDTEYLGDTGLAARLRGIMHLEDFDPRRLSLTAPSVAYTMMTSASRWSTMARFRQPIGAATIVRLKDIKRRMGERVELFSDESMLGFDSKEWQNRLFQKFPLDFSEGFKKNLGSYIKTNYNQKKKSMSFIVRKKVTPYQLDALIGYLEGKLPPFHYLTIYRKMKVFEEIYNLTGLQLFREYLRNELISAIHIKITW